MVYAGLGALSAAVLLLEITLTRVYSVTQGYHFAFLAVSLGLLGFGASGTALFVSPGLWRRAGRGLLGLSALLFTLTVLGSYWAVNRIPFDAYRLVLEPVMFLHLALFYLAPAVPFFFAGLALGGALSLWPRQAGGIYGASLVGSGLGAVLALVGPATWGPSGALGVATTLGAMGWAALGFRRSIRRLSLVALTGLALVAGGWILPGSLDLQLSPYKALPQVLLQQNAELAATEWNAFSRVDVVRSDALHQAPGLSFAYTHALPRQTALTEDGDNLTTLTALDPEEARFTEFLPTAVAYELLQQPRVLVVEPGGGLDVLTALHHGASEVVALVGNPLEANLLRGAFRRESAGLFADPRVRVIAGNPRVHLARSDDRFDLVIVSLRDAFRPITAGAYSLSENHLLTAEAFEAYLRHLAPGGVLMVTRWVQTPPSEELRAAATLIEALEGEGIGGLEEKLVAVRTLQTLTLLARKEPFTQAEAQAVRAFTLTRQMDLSYLPGIGKEELNRFFVLPEEVYYAGLRQLMDPAQRPGFFAEQTFDVAPSTDERPFFFHFFRWGQLPEVLARLGKAWEPFGGAGFLVVLAFLAVATVVSALLILVPLLARRTPEPQGSSSGGLYPRALVYFVALGLGFFWLELPLMQRFILLLDQPTYSFGVVLFSVLVFSGIGSSVSTRLGAYRKRAVLALALLAMAYAVGTPHLVELLLGLPLGVRILAAIVTIAPLAMLMGIPFPAGLAILEQRRPALVPWAWGANGYASVVGAALAALMALSWGFSYVMLAAGVAYLVAWAALFGPRSPKPLRVNAAPPEKAAGPQELLRPPTCPPGARTGPRPG